MGLIKSGTKLSYPKTLNEAKQLPGFKQIAPPTALISAINSSMDQINTLINPISGLGSGLSTISVDLLGFGNSAAAGGYVLYPSKPNNNMAKAVYAK
jgi:hypothetical protein